MSEIERAIEKKEYIERGAALELFWEYSGNWNLINAIPDADVEPVVRGEWKWEPPYTICSVCRRHSINRFQSKYCQHCGAKMNNPRGAHVESIPKT